MSMNTFDDTLSSFPSESPQYLHPLL